MSCCQAVKNQCKSSTRCLFTKILWKTLQMWSDSDLARNSFPLKNFACTFSLFLERPTLNSIFWNFIINYATKNKIPYCFTITYKILYLHPILSWYHHHYCDIVKTHRISCHQNLCWHNPVIVIYRQLSTFAKMPKPFSSICCKL